QNIKIEENLPGDLPPSFRLNNNKLSYLLTARIDVPRWPDWTNKRNLVIYRTKEESGSADEPTSVAPVEIPESQLVEQSQGITFEEAANHLWTNRADDESLAQIVEAVTGMRLPMQAIIERRLLYAGDDNPNPYPDGHTVWARYPDPPVSMSLCIRHDQADDFEQMGREPWDGIGVILGWDSDHGRLRVQVE
ncbi:MAG: hypothetical protein AAF664_04935, partial [Planctomycetota bacterium]